MKIVKVILVGKVVKEALVVRDLVLQEYNPGYKLKQLVNRRT